MLILELKTRSIDGERLGAKVLSLLCKRCNKALKQ